MEIVDASIPEIKADPENFDGNGNDVEDFGQRVDDMFVKVDQLEQTLNKVEQFYSSKKQLNTSKGSSIPKDKDKDKHLASFRKRQLDASRRESAAAKKMQELMRQFGTIIRQITQHKWAGPFMQPVDVVGLGLHDYYDVIAKPMDFGTIKNKMEAKDGSGYKSVREIYADVRLIFKNAMKYNDEREDVHVMAKTLLGKVDEKWLQLLPKVDEEEKNRKEEEAEAQIDMQLAQEATHARITKDLNIELEKVDRDLEELRDMVLQKCRYYSHVWLSAAHDRIPPHQDIELSQERNKCIKRYFPDAEARTAVSIEFARFSGQMDTFGSADSIEDKGTMDPKMWWLVHGAYAPNIQKIALKLLGQPCSSSCCERNWSTYSFIHSVRRNKILPTRAEDLVYVHNNLRLLSRKSEHYLKGETRLWDVGGDHFDPLDGAEELEIATLSLDEPEMEAMIYRDD